MNKKRFKSVMALHGDTQEDLAKYLGIPQSALSHRIAGTIDFRQTEIEHIAMRYNLSADDLQAIFFAKLVPCEET